MGASAEELNPLKKRLANRLSTLKEKQKPTTLILKALIATAGMWSVTAYDPTIIR